MYNYSSMTTYWLFDFDCYVSFNNCLKFINIKWTKLYCDKLFSWKRRKVAQRFSFLNDFNDWLIGNFHIVNISKRNEPEKYISQQSFNNQISISIGRFDIRKILKNRKNDLIKVQFRFIFDGSKKITLLPIRQYLNDGQTETIKPFGVFFFVFGLFRL